MLIKLKTWNGYTINDGTSYRAALLNPRNTPVAKNVYIEQTDSDADDAGTFTVDTQVLALVIDIANYNSRVSLIGQLKKYFKRGTQAYLVATFADDGVDYQKLCRVVNIAQDPDFPTRYNVSLQTAWTNWVSVSAQTDTWNSVTGTGGYKDITVGGDDETRLIMSLTATAAPSSGFFYQNMVRFPNVVGVNFGYRPWCLTVNTSALVTATKMRSDCYDLRVYNGDTEIKRWIADANTTTTHVWFNANMRAGASIKLKTAINNSDAITSLQFNTDATTKAAIKTMAPSGIVYHGTEWFYYSATDYANCKLTIKQRGIWGTTKQSHSANDAFVYIENPIRIVYGNLSATDPTLDDSNYDAEKPVFDLSASDNTKWVYTSSTMFYDPANPARTGQWGMVNKKNGTVSTLYQYYQNGDSGNSVMGMEAGAFQVNSQWKADTVELRWTLGCPGGFSKITVAGQKYRSGVNFLPAPKCEYSTNGSTWVALWTEASPSSSATWSSWSSHSSVTVPNTAKFLSISSKGTFSQVANAYALSEAQSATAEFYTTNMPTATLLGETNNYPMSLSISTNQYSDVVSLGYPALYNLAFLMDGENFLATFDSVNAHRAVSLDDMGRSTGWLRLKPGTNRITISGVDVGTLNNALSWYRRRQ